MEEQPTEITLRILQLNTHHSASITHSLLNDPKTSQHHFLLIQEPYLYPQSNAPIAHPAWQTVSQRASCTSTKWCPPPHTPNSPPTQTACQW
ncbi:hypothetical protein CROQUDRAFT_95067 [Cronartium quercuum f. sp. fusiforme G11]|uniref:Uncharacterized protein n=1 Tax=Cronartium quercuum f. sp. fusiforme G11 TaxID=708437 RepID=A0A9P6T9Q9_9BASI|nr:hypothetical protein CROQUDRAFT_95067 [Cronartium quercuum f. sp. fusiforme G11]